jgi:alanyl-tRNA synthetase
MDLDGLEVTTKYISGASGDIELEERYLLNWLYDTSGFPRWLINKKARDYSMTVDKQVRNAVAQVV